MATRLWMLRFSPQVFWSMTPCELEAVLRGALGDASCLSNSFASSLTRAFTDASVKGRDLSDVLKSLALSLSQSKLEAALVPISQAFVNSLSQRARTAASTAPFATVGL